MITLLMGGSPCTHWSIAQTKDRETEPSGIGWELFLNYRIARDKYTPDYFLYENNKSMAPAIRSQITRELGVEPVLINSALLSAQNRQRLYWVGKRNMDGTYSRIDIKHPEDRGILLQNILEIGVCWREKAYALKANYFKSATANFINGGGHYPQSGVAEPIRIGTVESAATNINFDSQQYQVYNLDSKSVTLCGNGGGVGAKTGLYAVRMDDGFVLSNGITLLGKTYPVYEVKDGLITIKDKQHPIKLEDGYYIIRKLTVTECKRLQTVPESYIFPVSDTQAYKMLGNGWTVDVIVHILSHISGITTEPVEVLSMYDGMSCGHIALDKLGANVERYYATEIDKYAIQTTMANYPETIQLGDAFRVRNDDWRVLHG